MSHPVPTTPLSATAEEQAMRRERLAVACDDRDRFLVSLLQSHWETGAAASRIASYRVVCQSPTHPVAQARAKAIQLLFQLCHQISSPHAVVMRASAIWDALASRLLDEGQAALLAGPVEEHECRILAICLLAVKSEVCARA